MRSKIAFISYDSALFTGTLRFNLDPAGKYSDLKLWSAIDESDLKSFVDKNQQGLDLLIEDNESIKFVTNKSF